jgi:hypothetical protein
MPDLTPERYRNLERREPMDKHAGGIAVLVRGVVRGAMESQFPISGTGASFGISNPSQFATEDSRL